jgi:virulence-associated protein VagC
VHRQAGVDHRVDEDDVAPIELDVEILQEPDAVVVVPVTGQLEEVEVVEDRDRARQVAEKRDAALQRADEQRLSPGVVRCQLGADLAYPGADLVGVEEDLSDAFVAARCRSQDAFRSPYRAASRAKSRS